MTDQNDNSSSYEHQMGGHGKIKQSTPGRLLKPTLPKEIAFYQAVASPTLPTHLHFLRDFLPTFYGVQPLPSANPAAHQHAIIIEDVNFPLNTPAVLDIKVGTRHYDDDASDEKKARSTQATLETTSAQTGLRIVGMQAVKYDKLNQNNHHDVSTSSSRLEFRGRDYGRAITVDNLSKEVLWFFHDGIQLRRDVIHMVRFQLNSLLQGMRKCDSFNFYASSLLVAYDGAISSANTNMHRADVQVRMIDFAHTVPAKNERDDGYLFGVETFLNILDNAD